MDILPWQPENTASQHEWALKNITTTFFSCLSWQVESTTDPINCPFHYFCETNSPKSLPSIIDLTILFFTFISYTATIAYTIKANTTMKTQRRYWLPSGPILLPLILIAFANGRRVNTIFPLANLGPALLQLAHVSVIAFEDPINREIKSVLVEASTISGILHASLYLESVILPYYTGLDAMVSSSFSGECESCVCRREALVVGGRLVSYRAWSATMFAVVATLCARIVCGLTGKNRVALLITSALEGLSWVFITSDCVYLMLNSPRGGLPERAAHGAVLALICLHVLKRVCNLLNYVSSNAKHDRIMH
ncbi:hypothetical protein QJS04_geneDACA001008 [Acorus gramineus]|uniref:Uncharacterized protein n=1 Tax=Acorus gramineus TaxID=55184 RepID=A0AAV9ABI1_ACOGR|nr:hypothetical protein QJS04_geneDACA001008 [Acorus gramineus]